MSRDKSKSPPGRRWLRDLALVVLALVAVQWWQTRDTPEGPAPALGGQLLGDRPVSLQDYRGKPLLVHFWATWCPVCRLEQGGIDALAKDQPVLTVATGSGTAAEVRAYLQQHGLKFPVLLDESGELARQWGVKGVPTSFIVDGQGRIRNAMAGYTSGWGLRARLWLAAD